MKRASIIIAALLLFCTHLAHALNLTLVWDANAPDEQIEFYTVYEETAPGEWVKIGQTADAAQTSYVVVFPEKIKRTFAITATNVFGESLLSAPVSTPSGQPSVPNNPRIEGKRNVIMESSENLEDWRELVVVASDREREFFRLRMD